MARSSLLLLLAGCDLAFGVGGEPDPCELGSFNPAHGSDITPAFRFSVDWDQRFAVIEDVGLAEIDLPSGTPRPISLGPYSTVNLALSPEGNALLYTASTEPPILEGALRASPGSWKVAEHMPLATYTGTPSADVFGPRHMLARMRPTDEVVQELEDRDGTWVAIGEPHPLVSEMPPNLTPNGLTAVYASATMSETGTTFDVYGMTRASTDEWFGTPTKLLENGDDHAPQLLGHCERLYTIHGDMLRSYDR